MSIPVSAQSDPVLGGIYLHSTSGTSRYEVVKLDPLTLRGLDRRTMEDPVTGEEVELPCGEEFVCDPGYFRAEFGLVG
jgi:hypothetical protein